MGGLKSQICSNIACRIWDICTKTNCRFQKQIHMEQSILRQTINLEYWRMLLSGKSIWVFFIKLLKKFENQIWISLLLETRQICVLASKTRGNGLQCLLLYLEKQLFLHVPTFQSCRLSISQDPLFLVITKKFDIAKHKEPPTMEKPALNSNQGNNTTEKFLQASLRLSNRKIILNNTHTICMFVIE